MKSSISNTDSAKSVRKIVTFGRPSSGKTCLVAALAMDRLSHPRGYETTWVKDETTIPKLVGGVDQYDMEDRLTSLHFGRERLNEKINELERYDLPDGDKMDLPYRYLFDFSTLDGCIRRVEMIDYSGELVDDDITEGDFAKTLSGHMKEADGIIVLAEATNNSEQEERVRRDLRKLRMAFQRIVEDRPGGRCEPFPICMVYDKWDRISAKENCSLDFAQHELEEYLERNKDLPHHNLRNVLKAAAGHPDTFIEFPVSAFGQSKLVEKETGDGTVKIEVPANVNPLKSYGLEDPYITLCEIIEQREQAQLQSNYETLAPWKIWQVIKKNPVALEISKNAVKLSNYFPPKTEMHHEARSVSQKAMKAFQIQLLSTSMFSLTAMFLLVQFSFLFYDGLRFADLMPKITAQATEYSGLAEHLPKWKEGEKFLREHETASWLRFFSHCRYSIRRSKTLRSELLEKIALATNTIAKHDEIEIKLESLRAAAKNAVSAEELIEHNEVLGKIEIPEQFPELIVLKSKIVGELILEQGRTERTEHAAALRTLVIKKISESDVVGACNELGKDTQIDSKARELIMVELIRLAKKTIENKLNGLAKNSQWDPALNYLQRIESNSYCQKLLGKELLGELYSAKRWLKNDEKRNAYYEWYYRRNDQRKSSQAIELGHQKDVIAHQEYVAYCNRPDSWTVDIDKVYFVEDNGWGFSSVKIKVQVAEGSDVQSVAGFVSKGDGATAKGSGSFVVKNKTPDEKFNLSFKLMTTNNNIESNSILGSGELNNVTIRDLQSAKKIVCLYYGKYKNAVTISLRRKVDRKPSISKPTPFRELKLGY